MFENALNRLDTNGLIWWPGASLESVIQGKGADLVNIFVGFSVLVAVILIVVAGYLFITSAGDPEKVEKAQKTITAAIVGMIIVFLARVIVGFVLEDVLKVVSEFESERSSNVVAQEF